MADVRRDHLALQRRLRVAMIVRGMDLYQLRDPQTGRWIEGGEKAALDLVERKFDPRQLRDPGGENGGQWVKNPADELNLAGRIHLDPGERLVSSSRYGDLSDSDVDLLFAVVHSPFGSEVRIGVIPSDSAEEWTADAEGATAGLTGDELRQARTDLAAAAAVADHAADTAAEAWDSGGAPTDPKQLGVVPVASGRFLSANHDDLDWEIYVNDQSSWNLSIAPTEGESSGTLLDPLETIELLNLLSGLQGELDAPGR